MGYNELFAGLPRLSQGFVSMDTPYWTLRRDDQKTLAVLAALCLAFVAAWLCWNRMASDPLVELDAVRPQTPNYQVDLNVASREELDNVPGVGAALAERIIESRERSGPFRKASDLMRVSGIGVKTLAKIKPYLAPLEDDTAENGSRK